MAAGEKPMLMLKPKYAFSIFLFRTIYLYFLGALFLSAAGIIFSAMASSDASPNFAALQPINTVWGILYLIFLVIFMPGRYKASSYRFYSDRVDYDAIKAFSMEGRSVMYARVIETGCVKELPQQGRGMGNIILKVAAAGINPGAQNTVMLDNLVLADVENIDENLEKVREIIQKKA